MQRSHQALPMHVVSPRGSQVTDLVNTEIPRDRFGRPMIMQTGGKRLAYRRCTTFVGCLEDTYNLMAWKNRKVAYGMGQRKDLVLAAAAADPEDKRKLGEIADAAVEHAQASAAATTGTALHSLTERIDRGQELGYVPAEYQADIDAYREATKDIEWLQIETFRVHDKWQIAGTADRIGKDKHGNVMIYDLKTGSIDFPHKMAMQLAMYARSVPYDIATDTRTADPEPVSQRWGVIIHLPAGSGQCTLHRVDIVAGWGACILAHDVWKWRGQKGLIEPLAENKIPATWQTLVANAVDVDALREIWTRAKECSDLDDALKELLMARRAELA